MERREYSMWNCDWEYENQETLKQWYEEKLAGIRPYSAVRKIICKGCGKTCHFPHLQLLKNREKPTKQKKLWCINHFRFQYFRPFS